MRIKVDASDNVIIEVLLIDCKDRQWRLVAYLSKSLNKIEIQGLDRLQKLRILYESTKVKLKTN